MPCVTARRSSFSRNVVRLVFPSRAYSVDVQAPESRRPHRDLLHTRQNQIANFMEITSDKDA